MGELDVQLAGKSLADHTNTQLRLALGAVLYTNTADMWRKYLNQMGYSGDIAQMLQKYYSDYSVPQNMRNYINAGAFVYTPQQLFRDGSIGVFYDNNDFVDSATWRRNLLTYSEQFDNAVWTKTNSSISANATTAPDGAVTADKLIEDSSLVADHRVVSATQVLPVGVVYTSSFYAKASERNFVRVFVLHVASTSFTVNLASGGITFQANSGGVTASATLVGNGWYRISYTYTVTVGTAAAPIYLAIAYSSAGAITGTGDGTSGIFIWGAQLELGSTATTYQRITDFNSNFLAAFPNTTLFADAAGTTPALVNGPVGLQLDKSQGLVLGPEKIVNGDFSEGSTGWGITGTDATHVLTFSNGTVRYQSDTTTPNLQLSQTLPSPSATAMYVAEISISNYVSGSLKFDSDAGDRAIPASVGVHRFYFRRASGGFTIYRNSANVDITIDYVSVRQVLGNHRYQDSAASRPTLRGTPTGANLVTNGDFASGAGWTTGAGWSIGSGVATSTGSLNSTLDRPFATTNGKTYLVTYTISGYTAGQVRVRFTGTANVSGTLRGANGTYVEYITATSDNSTLRFVDAGSGFSGSIDNVDIRDVSAGQVTAPYGLQYDGVDDFMQTASVNFSATDKMFVCAGVRKLSDAAFAILVELSPSLNTNNGTFYISAPSGGGGNNYQSASKGTLSSPVGTATSFASPNTAVLTGTGDISGDLATIKVNSGSPVNGTGDQGTGNYGNYALYFGRRNGASNPYNGLDFGFVIVGKTLTATQISQAERFIAQRTGVTL